MTAASVIIAVKNAGAHLGAQLEAIGRQELDRPWEVIVVDNGSSDGSGELARSFATRLPGLRVLEATDGVGAAYARNRGAEEATGDSLLFLDADDVVGDGFLGAMVAALAGAPLACARMEYRRLNPDWVLAFRDGTTQTASIPDDGFLPHCSGSCLGIRRSLFDGLEGFDRASGWEDMDFSWRAQLSGAAPVFVPDAVLHYRFRTDVRSTLRQGLWYGESSARITLLWRDHLEPAPAAARARSWADAVRALAPLRSRADLCRVAWELGWRAGRLAARLRLARSPEIAAGRAARAALPSRR